MNTILVLEIGNSTIGCALFAVAAKGAGATERQTDAARITAEFRLTSEAISRAAYAERLTAQCAECGIDPRAVHAVFLASVVPPLTAIVRAAVELVTGVAAQIINADSRLGVTVRPHNRQELGTDIILNLAEAWHRRPHQPAIVVDFGTAITVSAIDSRGVICGVAIAPGLTVAMESLTAATAQLPPISLRFPPAAMGTDTVSAIQSGIMHGYCGLVAALVRDFRRELGAAGGVAPGSGAVTGSGAAPDDQAASAIPAIATGGNGRVIHSRIPEIAAYLPHLTVRGLLRIGLLNSQPHL